MGLGYIFNIQFSLLEDLLTLLDLGRVDHGPGERALG